MRWAHLLHGVSLSANTCNAPVCTCCRHCFALTLLETVRAAVEVLETQATRAHKDTAALAHVHNRC
jgi:hypothetical protein